MTFSVNQKELLAVVGYMCSITRSAQSSEKFSEREKSILLDRQQKILDATAVVSTLISANCEDPAEADAVFGAIRALGAAMFDIGMITHTTEATQRYSAGLFTKAAREASAKKVSPRDIILNEVLGNLIESGLKGEDLRQELIRIFAQRGIRGQKSSPGLRIVQTWAQQYREGTKWKPETQS